MNFFSFIFGDAAAGVLLSAVVLVIAAYVVGRLLRWLLSQLANKIAKKSRSQFDDMLLGEFARHITMLVTLGVAYYALLASREALALHEDFPEQLTEVLTELTYIALVFVIAWSVTRLIDTVIRWYLHEVAARTHTHLDDELAPLVNRLLKVLIYSFALILVLDHFGQNISTLVVSLGVGSLALALAAQETLANMIAGFVLMIDRPFRVGDRICLPDGTIGNVKEIGIRSTKVIDDAQVMIITPNAEIVKSQIKNFSYPNDIVRFEVDFGVAYGTDLEAMRAIIIARINGEGDILEPETTEVRVVEMGESSVQTRLMCKIRNPNNIPRRKSDLLLVIYNTLRAHGIEIPFPQRVLHIARENGDELARGSGEGA